MAKNTKPQEAATGTSDSYTPEEWAAADEILRNRPVLGVQMNDPDMEVKPSVGSNSEASSEKESSSNEQQKPLRRGHAPDVVNPFSQDPPEHSGVRSTGGSGQTTEEPLDEPQRQPRKAAKATKAAPAKRVRPNSDDDF